MAPQNPLNEEDDACERFKKTIEDIASYEGKYLDYWSIVHTSTGFILGLILNWIGFSITEAFFITAFILTFWEVIEPDLYKILKKFFPKVPPFTEKSSNTLVDILVGMIGFVLAKIFDVFLDSYIANELVADFSIEAPDLLMVLRALLIFIPLTLIFIPTKLLWQQGGEKRKTLNKKTATKAFCKKLDELISKVNESDLSKEEKKKLVDELKKAKELVEKGKFGDAGKVIDKANDTLGKGKKEIKKELSDLSTWALLMNVKENWTPGNNRYGIKSFSIECDKKKNECFVVLVLVIPKKRYDEDGDEFVENVDWISKKIRRKIKFPCENCEKAKKLIAAAVAKLNNCEWPSEKDVKEFSGLLTKPVEEDKKSEF